MYPDSSARRQTPARGQRNTEVISRNSGRGEKKERAQRGREREKERERRPAAAAHKKSSTPPNILPSWPGPSTTGSSFFLVDFSTLPFSSFAFFHGYVKYFSDSCYKQYHSIIR